MCSSLDVADLILSFLCSVLSKQLSHVSNANEQLSQKSTHPQTQSTRKVPEREKLVNFVQQTTTIDAAAITATARASAYIKRETE